MKKIAILLAAGKGVRFGSDKILHFLSGKSIVSYSLEKLNNSKQIDKIILVASKNNIKELRRIAKDFNKVEQIVLGDKTRLLSTKAGFLASNAQKDDLLIFHNAANSFVTEKEITASTKEALKYGASGVAHKATSTVRQINDNKTTKVLPRKSLFLMETPQVLTADIYSRGLEYAEKNHLDPTDDLSLAEFIGISPKIIEADCRNKKITFLEDLDLDRPSQIFNFNNFNQNQIGNNFTVGIGQDSHPFSSSGKCILGGIIFDNEYQLTGNSDGDAALHALTNAILSGIGEGSLSTFSDKMCAEGIKDSTKYLQEALKKLAQKGGKIENCSLAFECLKPKLETVFPKMRKKLADLLNLKTDKIGLTATTGEGLTSFGRGEGVQVFAAVLISFEK